MDHLPKADPHLQQKNWDAFFKCMEIKGYIWVEDCGERVLLQIKDYVMNDEYNVSTKTKVNV